MSTTAYAVAPRRHLLPPQSTPLERAVDEVMPAWDTLANAFAPPSAGTPQAFMPWLAAEWELGQFARYFPTLDALIAAALPWRFERGSAASVRRVLAWLGFADVRIEEDGAFLHINLGRVATAEEIGRIAHVVRASVPAHVYFYRVFWGYDARPIKLDAGPALDVGQLDDDSGVWVSVQGDDPLKASFGVRHGGTVPRAATRADRGLYTHALCAKTVYDDRPVLDAWRLDSRIMVDAFAGIGELYRSTTTAPQPGPPMGVGGVVHMGQSGRAASKPALAAQAGYSTAAPVPLPTSHDWTGSWDSTAWRPLFIELKSTEST